MSIRSDYEADLQTRVTRVVSEATGLHEPIAANIAIVIVQRFFHELGGERVYFGKRVSVRELVRMEFDGSNRKALCKKYRISRSTFYRFTKQD